MITLFTTCGVLDLTFFAKPVTDTWNYYLAINTAISVLVRADKTGHDWLNLVLWFPDHVLTLNEIMKPS